MIMEEKRISGSDMEVMRKYRGWHVLLLNCGISHMSPDQPDKGNPTLETRVQCMGNRVPPSQHRNANDNPKSFLTGSSPSYLSIPLPLILCSIPSLAGH